MGVFLVLCALGCLVGIGWAIQSNDVSSDGAGVIAAIFTLAAVILLAMAAVNINGHLNG